MCSIIVDIGFRNTKLSVPMLWYDKGIPPYHDAGGEKRSSGRRNPIDNQGW